MNIIDAFVVTFALDASGYKKGERDVDESTKRLREEQKKAFDEMEARGKNVGEVLKSVRTEVIGLGLAFMGVKSIGGLISGMMTGAASADRLGQTMGMSAKQIWAWRMAMKGVGGDAKDADAAMQAIQNAKMGWQIHGDTGNNVAFARLGITGNDFRDKDVGSILEKLADMQGKMDPQVYASLLQQIGLPASTIYFLQQGKDSVDKMLRANEANAKGQEQLAKETEHLQAAMANLQAVIAGKLVPVLTRIFDWLNRIIPVGSDGGDQDGSDDGKDTESAPGVWGMLGLRGPKGYWSGKTDQHASANKKSSDGTDAAPGVWGMLGLRGPKGYWSGKTGSSANRRGATRAERNNNPGNIEDGAFARRQPGYIGSDGRFARFATAADGGAAMEKLLASYLRSGRDTIAAIVSKWAPSSENNTAAYIRHIEQLTHLSRYQHLQRSNLHQLAAAMATHEGFRGNVTNNYNIKATDPKGTAAEIARTQQRRHAVAQADRGVAS